MNAADPAQLLTQARTIAVVGMSTDPAKPSHFAPAELLNRGWNVIPIHPSADEIAGQKVYRSLGEVPEPIDLVNVFRPAAEAPGIAREAASLGVATLWLQQGIVSPEARQIAEQAGMAFVENTCAGATAARAGLQPPAVG